MQRLTNLQLNDMFRLQDSLNRTVNPGWLTANYPWTRAIRVECAELTDHIGWKWWKKQEPNWAQAQIELVDIWHFMLSEVLANSKGDVLLATAEMNVGFDIPYDDVMDLLGKKFTIGGSKLHDLIDLLSAFASAGYVVPAIFEGLMVRTGMTWEGVRRIYVGKNVLNRFRQANGYKDGTYVKEWNGVEDNVRLEQLMEGDPSMTADQLHAALYQLYALVAKPLLAQVELPLQEAA